MSSLIVKWGSVESGEAESGEDSGREAGNTLPALMNLVIIGPHK